MFCVRSNGIGRTAIQIENIKWNKGKAGPVGDIFKIVSCFFHFASRFEWFCFRVGKRRE